MKPSIVVFIAAAFVATNATSIFITKSITSNSESQVVAYMKQKDAEGRAEAERTREVNEKAADQAAEAARRLFEYGRNPKQ